MVVLLQTFFPRISVFHSPEDQMVGYAAMGSGLYAAIRSDILVFHPEVRSSHCVSDLSCTLPKHEGAQDTG